MSLCIVGRERKDHHINTVPLSDAIIQTLLSCALPRCQVSLHVLNVFRAFTSILRSLWNCTHAADHKNSFLKSMKC